MLLRDDCLHTNTTHLHRHRKNLRKPALHLIGQRENTLMTSGQKLQPRDFEVMISAIID